MKTPTLRHFVYSLPPEGAAAALGAARRRPKTPTLRHFVYSLPPGGAAAALGAARRRPEPCA